MKKAAVMLGVVIMVLGCSYYRVTDPQTGKVYFTTKVKQRGSGAVTLKDADTGVTATIQNSELEKISSKEFKERGVPEPETPVEPAAPIEAEEAEVEEIPAEVEETPAEVEEISSEEVEEISAPEPETPAEPAEPIEADDTE